MAETALQSQSVSDSHGSLPLVQPPDAAYSPTPKVDRLVQEISQAEVKTMVTVEDFLRWSSEPVLKRYGNRKRKFADVRGYSEDESDKNGSDYRPSDSESTELQSTRHVRRRLSRRVRVGTSKNADVVKSLKKHRQRLSEKSLADRLLTAAVLSHVEIGPAHADDEQSTHIRGRPPLKFIRVDRVSSPASIANARRGNVVDPRRVAPFHDVAFSFAGTSSPQFRDSVRKPITKWRPTASMTPTGYAMSSRRGKGATGGSSYQLGRYDVIPLVFVPLPEHEAGFNVTFSEWRAHPDCANNRCRNTQLSGNAEYPPLPFVPPVQVVPNEHPQYSRGLEDSPQLPLQKQVAFSSPAFSSPFRHSRSTEPFSSADDPVLSDEDVRSAAPSEASLSALRNKHSTHAATSPSVSSATATPLVLANCLQSAYPTTQLSPIAFAAASSPLDDLPTRSPTLRASHAADTRGSFRMPLSATRSNLLEAKQIPSTVTVPKNLKPLKPLFSFFDDFLKTARAVTAAANAQCNDASVTGSAPSSRLPASAKRLPSDRGPMMVRLHRDSAAQARLKLDVLTGEVRRTPRLSGRVRKRPSASVLRRPPTPNLDVVDLSSSSSIVVSVDTRSSLASRPSMSPTLNRNSARLASVNIATPQGNSSASSASFDILAALRRTTTHVLLPPTPCSAVARAPMPYALADEETCGEDESVGLGPTVDFFGGLRMRSVTPEDMP
ncbi:hypothetical protein BKA93DRAFT_830533 [Sparassis latifolia]